MKRNIEKIVGENFDGKTVGVFLRNEMSVSAALMRRLKTFPDGIMLNGERVFVNEKIKTGDSVFVSVEDSDSSENILPVEGKIDIIFEDDDFLILNKEANIPVHPSKGHPYDSLANRVAFYYKEKGDKFIFRCVTRLDRGTSGICVIAKNSYAGDLLSREMRNGNVSKTYKAVVVGNFPYDEGIIDRNIRRIPDSATIKREVCDNDGAKAVTLYKKIEEKNGITLLEIKLITGRTHQIRVHFSSAGYPLVGDWLYGKESEAICRHALHCEKIEFIHPITKQYLSFFAKLPEDIKNLLS